MPDNEDQPLETPPQKVTELQVQPKADPDQLLQFVTTIKNAEQQVGEHIITALRQDNTVAVLTTAAVGPDGQQRVLSIALNAERLSQVEEVLKQAIEEREPEDPCVGFHCLVKPKKS